MIGKFACKRIFQLSVLKSSFSTSDFEVYGRDLGITDPEKLLKYVKVHDDKI